jgi:hypothetical protein
MVKMYSSPISASSILILLLSSLTPTTAQEAAAADGALVPFTSALPVCASKCGPLYDVQGGCTTQSCFCADARLTTISSGGTAAVSTICGAASCTAQADLQKVADWYKSFCPSNAGTASTSTAAAGNAPGATTTAPGSAPTGTGTTSGTTGNVNSDTTNGVVVHRSWYVFSICLSKLQQSHVSRSKHFLRFPT